MAQLCLIRHGQTDWNLERRWQGHIDSPLNAAGLKQAEVLADELGGSSFNAIYSSDLQRARVTAEAIASYQKLPVVTDPRLRELNMGEWEGCLISEIPALFPEAWAARQSDPISSYPTGGESIQQLSTRVISAVTSICVENKPDARIIIVSHGLALGVVICYVQNISLDLVFEQIPRNAEPAYRDWIG